MFYRIPRQYLDLYNLADISEAENPMRPPGLPPIAWNPWVDLRKREDIKALNISLPYGKMPSMFARYIRHHYYAGKLRKFPDATKVLSFAKIMFLAVTYVDNLIGEVLQSLVANGLADNTIVTLFGDHGWSLGEHQVSL